MHEQDDAPITDRLTDTLPDPLADRRVEKAAAQARVEAERDFWDRMARADGDGEAADPHPAAVPEAPVRPPARDAG